ncbi:MAG: YaeQ family protein [Bdellovibrionota bacterium]
MAFATLYRFRIDLSDVDRGVYEALDFRAALHPSETPVYLVTRVLAFALNAQEGLAFSPGGLSDPDAPCMKVDDAGGGVRLWVEIGNPSARKLHKASKAADEVRVYTYKDPKILLDDIRSQEVHRAESLGIFSFDPRFLEKLVDSLEKDNAWSLLCSDGSLVVSLSKDRVEQSELKRHVVSSP